MVVLGYGGSRQQRKQRKHPCCIVMYKHILSGMSNVKAKASEPAICGETGETGETNFPLAGFRRPQECLTFCPILVETREKDCH